MEQDYRFPEPPLSLVRTRFQCLLLVSLFVLYVRFESFTVGGSQGSRPRGSSPRTANTSYPPRRDILAVLPFCGRDHCPLGRAPNFVFLSTPLRRHRDTSGGSGLTFGWVAGGVDRGVLGFPLLPLPKDGIWDTSDGTREGDARDRRRRRTDSHP